VRRRFHAGLRNFFSLYQPMADTLRIFDNSGTPPPRLVAAGRGRDVTLTKDATTWTQLTTVYRDQPYAE
jgi:predicted ABC-type ATPase